MRRGVTFVVLVGVVTACGGGDDRSPFAESRTPPNLAERFYPPEGWAWGFVKVGDSPAQRYGVSAPASVSRANILILPDYGEIAETWFETARDLNRRGYSVWVLDAAGQGGSGRLVLPRDLGYVEDFQADIAAVRAMTSTVIRPRTTARPVILGQGVGAVIAALAVEQRSPAPAGLILSSPKLRVSPAGAPADSYLSRLFSIERARIPGTGRWRPDMKDEFTARATHDPWRGAVTLAWQGANPDLRMGGPSLRWQRALHEAGTAARYRLAAIQVPTLVIAGADGPDCSVLPRCSAVRLGGGGISLEIENDTVRDGWLSAIDSFIRGQVEDDDSQAALQAGAAAYSVRDQSSAIDVRRRRPSARMATTFEPDQINRNLFDALLDAAHRFGSRKPILEDQERNPFSYADLIRASFALGRKLARMTSRGDRVGLLLPSSSAAVVTFFALQAFGRVPAMLNFTAGIRNLSAAAKLVGIERRPTSHRFIEQGKLHDLVDALEGSCEITYLEDVRKTTGTPDRAYALAARWLARQLQSQDRT